MITSASPFFARGSIYQGLVSHLAISDENYSVSDTGLYFYDAPIVGDLASYSGFKTRFVVEYAGLIWLGGATDTNPQQARLFKSAVASPLSFSEISTGINTTDVETSLYELAGIAANGTYIVVLANDGSISISTNGGSTFTAGQKIPFSGFLPAHGILASASGFVAYGADGQLFTASDPSGTWVSRNSQFGTNSIDAGIVAGAFVVSGGKQFISSAPLNDLSTWTLQNSDVTGALEQLGYDGSRLFAGGSHWLTSTNNGDDWSVPANTPGLTVKSIYEKNSRWFVHFGAGELSYSDDAASWINVSSIGLPGVAINIAVPVS